MDLDFMFLWLCVSQCTARDFLLHMWAKRYKKDSSNSPRTTNVKYNICLQRWGDAAKLQIFVRTHTHTHFKIYKGFEIWVRGGGKNGATQLKCHNHIHSCHGLLNSVVSVYWVTDFHITWFFMLYATHTWEYWEYGNRLKTKYLPVGNLDFLINHKKPFEV